MHDTVLEASFLGSSSALPRRNYLAEGRVPPASGFNRRRLAFVSGRLCLGATTFAPEWLRLQTDCNVAAGWQESWAVANAERVRLRAMIDAVVLQSFRLDLGDANRILRDCSRLCGKRGTMSRIDPKGFWRVEMEQPPELRHTVLTLVAFHDLQQKIDAAGGSQGPRLA